MLNLGAVFEIIKLYLSLSVQGKRFLKKAIAKSRRVDKAIKKSVAWDLAKILYFVKNFKVCDQVFSAQVSDQLCFDLRRDKSSMYARFVSYGWFSLLMWGKMLEAFNLAYDEAAQQRCVLVAFTHREWNDLFDNQGYSFGQLVQAFDYQSTIPQPLIFLRQLKQMERKLVSPERFSRYYQHMQGFDVCRLFEYTPEKSEIILDQVAPFVALLFMYIMVEEIPEGLKETIKPVARWLYMLDELADLEHDKQINRITYMIMVKDPEKAIWEQFQQCRKVILRNAPGPDKLIKFMETITCGIIDAKQRGVDIENSFFNIGG
ncbi:MAG: hypothetical protein V1830_05390 [Candidatus Omnitrophota bacterium]